MKRSGPLKRRSRVNPRNADRKARETARAYGPAERRAWIRGLPCMICGYGPSINAHVRTGGMGRKADARHIIPLCATHDGEEGCHEELHRIGRAAFEEIHQCSLDSMAVNTEAAWRAYERQGA